jgi:L-fuculose-phosphate aldolase
MLGDLQKGDIIETGLEREDSKVILASTETVVHRAIYRETSALAIVHCHPPFAIALSLEMDGIVPLDSEGSYLLHRVPVATAGKTVGSKDVAQLLPPLLKEYKIVMLRGHGSFAVGEVLEEALMSSSTLEVSSKIMVIARLLGIEIKEYRSESEKYTTW